MQSLIGKVTLNENQVMYLDVLRALAAETVLVSHATRFWQSLQPAAAPAFGVLLFFLISGFLITRSVQNRWDVPGFGFRSYAIERFARIYTAMVPAICLVAIVDAFSADTGHFENADRLTVVNWFGNLAMLQDFPVFLVARRALGDSDWFIRPFGSAQPFWTLSIEWWIYIVFGWVALVRLRGQRLVFWGHLGLAFAIVTPAYHFAAGYADGLTLYWMTGMAASLFYPALVRLTGHAAAAAGLSWRQLILLGTSTCLAAMAIRLARNNTAYEYAFTIFTAGAIFLPLYGLERAVRPVAAWLRRAVAFVAGYSYSLYLIHATIIIYWASLRPDTTQSPTTFLAILVVANAAAILFWGAFERHYPAVGRALKRRFLTPSRTAAWRSFTGPAGSPATAPTDRSPSTRKEAESAA